MGVIQRTPLLSHTAAQVTFSGPQHPELLWMGLGVLLGFFLVSIIFGTLETIRGNSPDAYKNHETAVEILKDEVTEKDAGIQDLNLTVGQLNATIAERGQEIDLLKQRIIERNTTIANRNATITEGYATLVERSEAIAERRQEIDLLKQRIIERDATIAESDATIVERDATIAERYATVVERDATIVERDATIAEKNDTIAGQAETIAEQDQRIRELGLQVNNHEQQLRVARRTIGDLGRDIERQGRRINFLTQENADLRAQLEQIDPRRQQPSPVPPRAEILEDLENRVAELGLQVNASQGDLRNARRTIRDLETAIARKDRMIQFLNQRIADHNVDDSDDDRDDSRLITASAPPQIPAAPIDTGPITSGPIPNSQVRRLVTGLHQVLHLLGGCPRAQDHRAQLEGLDVLVENMRDLVEQLNDSMFEELAQMVLDVMGHLGVRQ